MLSHLILRSLLSVIIVVGPTPSFRPYRRPVTLWVPPYAIDKSKAQLPAVQDAITHLDLQFWVPTKTGGVAKVGFDEVTDKVIAELRDWGHAHGIRVMLCVFNAEKDWDWPLAKAAFADHRSDLVKNLVAEMERRKLDGIDIDLEGPGSFDADKDAFISFMSDLSKALRQRKKHLTVDSFCYKWNAPNQTWWPDIFPLVDSIVTMGYEETGLGAEEWRSYAAQKTAAGTNAAKLQIGIPSDKETWKGNTALEQLQWIGNDATMGIGIWDAQLPAKVWRLPEVWQAVKAIALPKK
ncbi:glycoside hydrolase family 18 protein [Fimbriimonas ginsengisoli]|uniref:GH18 domain-containing protein n=1 Tax=Fimbriimonas ginsengisoli Gsoil 348 TaxID=661478 RepID=A0A068NRH2_FIMGI|nr:glycoside hydrolase family 18 protein [Fimbriimonas ginsengisoli]AIE86118.1 hypothetical protein OP10G_2750 [Fimbriimonas ginsengisoli Gsoil 348]